MRMGWSSSRIWRFALLAAAGSLLAVLQAAAQQPTQSQISAVKAACRSDYMAHCSSVTPGGKAALACLQKNAASLSAPCQSAVNAIGGGAAPASAAQPASPEPSPSGASTDGAPAAAPETEGSAGAGGGAVRALPHMSPRQELRIIRFSCGPDYRMFCGGTPPGGGRVVACLRANQASLSPQCRRALAGALHR
jgi:hypothetical protein